MGVVYLAEYEVLRREVAVKVVRDDRDGIDEALVRLRREALLLARVAHPNVVTVFDVGDLPGGGAYVVMERLSGRTLQAELAAKARLPWREALDVLDGVLLALEAAHAVGVVHRDVKPGNVFLVDGAPRVRLVDFGLARKVTLAEGDSLAATRTGMVVGSAGYIAPELLLGDPAGPAADVFAAGVVGYEMLAGRRPFPGTTLVALHEQMTRGPATPLRELVPDVPASVAEALADALRPSPAERPAGAEALRVRLRATT
jgi:serine/threonine-protein kinase